MSNRLPYLKNLSSKIEGRKILVVNSSWEMFPSELNSFLDFLKRQPITASIVNKLESITQEYDMSHYNLGGPGMTGGLPNLPKNEDIKIAFYYSKLKEVIESGDRSTDIILNTAFANNKGYENITRSFKEQVFKPFYSYIYDKVRDGDFLLYLLYRYKLNTEWFNKDALFEIYTAVHKEKHLDSELRKFLFDQGIDYPFSKPNTASGEPDVVIFVQESPLPLEVKVFDPERGYAKNRIIDGFNQAYRYIEDYNTHLAYLVIFNPSDTYLTIDSISNPPSLRVGGKEILGIVIDINPNRPVASKEKAPNRVSIKQEDIDKQSLIS